MFYTVVVTSPTVFYDVFFSEIAEVFARPVLKYYSETAISGLDPAEYVKKIRTCKLLLLFLLLFVSCDTAMCTSHQLCMLCMKLSHNPFTQCW